MQAVITQRDKCASLGRGALDHARRGWLVLPLNSATAGSVGPLADLAVGDASDDEDIVTDWWEAIPDANVGIATGSVSGLAVLRFSDDKLAPTLTAIVTEAVVSGAPRVHHPDGSTDLYFASPATAESGGQLAPGLQLLLDGDIALAPPSRCDGELLAFESNLPEVLPALPWSVPDLKALVEHLVPPSSTVAESAQVSAIWAGTHGTWRARFDRLSEIEPEPVSWFLRNRIPSGELCLLSGPGGGGKSLLTVDLTARVSCGVASPLNDEPMRQGAVLLMGREDRLARTVRPRVDAAGGDPTQILSLNEVRRGGVVRALKLPGDIEAIERLCKSEGVALIVIDPVADVLPGINLNSEQDVRAALLPLSDLAHRLDITIILIRHVTKSGAGRGVDRALGSVAFGNVVRAGVEVAETEGRLALRPTKGNLAGSDVPDLLFEIETVRGPSGQAVPRVNWLGEFAAPPVVKARSKMEEAQDFLLDLLRNGPVAAREVQAAAKKAGIASRTLSTAKKNLGIESKPAGGRTARWYPPTDPCITASSLGDDTDAEMEDLDEGDA